MMMKQTVIKKAVFPVAGLGTRFLPATKASPKEMLTIVDKPLIQYAVEEAAAAGITDMIFVTGRGKRALEDHFDTAYELENELEAKGKHELLELVRSVVPSGVNCIYIRQNQPLGLGHAVLCAEPIVGQEPFAVLLADDLMTNSPGQPEIMQQMVDVFIRERASMIAVQNVPREHTKSYGIVSEKPKPEDAPSTLAAVGRYVFTPRIFDYLRNLQPGSGGELQLTDAIALLLAEQPVFAYKFEGKRYDCGSKLGFLKATIDLAINHNEVGDEFLAYLKSHPLFQAQ
jgi:UTP--glucose-1-phosphate uridylyltransferase